MNRRILNAASSRSARIAEWRLRSRYSRFLVSGSAENDDHTVLRQALRTTRGAALDRLAPLFTDRYGGCSDLAATREARQTATEISDAGYSVKPGFFASERHVDRFRDAAVGVFTSDSQVSSVADVLTGSATSSQEMYFLPEMWVLQQALTRQLLCDPYVLSVAALYLGVSPVLSQVNAWFSFRVPGLVPETSAQNWHWDCDRVKWLKVFLYLTEVSDHSGPHEFVRGSHKRLPKTPMSSRLTSEKVGKMFDDEEIVTFAGSRGTLIFEDTRGLHRGRPVIEGYRLVLQLEFSVDLFGAPTEPLPDSARNLFDSETTILWPRLFLRGFR